MKNKTIYTHRAKNYTPFIWGAIMVGAAAVKDSAEVNAVENLASPPQTTLVYLHIFCPHGGNKQ
jgi:hypothetical protein